jgi:phage terminase large subunit
MKQYTREAVDTYTGKTEKRFGFKTTSLTRPTIISRLIEVIREHCNTVNDIDTLEELLTIIRNERGRIEAPEGGHDDMMMALAIAHHIREQVVIPNDIMEMSAHDPFGLLREFGSEDERGTERTII